jgi:eukaryotic-like serine/threonine-protein kinase
MNSPDTSKGGGATPESLRWQRIEELFHAAVPLAPEERERFLAGACADDHALRRELEALLGAAGDSDRFLADLSARTHELAGGVEPPRPARRLGAWELREQIGSGGMGVVWRAERADGAFRKEVALKLLAATFHTEGMRRRFAVERQILARLEHPGIARLLDAGVAEDGTPYMAMELVAGERIDGWCDRRRLGIEGRLRLFLQVCEAVGYAHGQLVVHRDIKPSNVLVTEDGTARLLDFGIARVLEEDDPDLRGVTATHVLTPAYASPEQIRGEPLTTATDVYALGALLYELLTGRPPRDPGGLTLEQMIRQAATELPPASRSVRPEGAAARGSSPAELARRLRGDLELILGRALHPEPRRRYATAAALAEDIQRFLDRRPVAARRDSAAYRARKLVQRRPAAVALAAGLVAASVFYLATVRQYAAQLEGERNVAELEAAKARQVTDFLVALFDPQFYTGTARDSITAAMLAREARERLADSFQDQPLVRASMLGAVAEVWSLLGNHEEAVNLAGEAVALLEQAGGSVDDLVANLVRQGNAARSGRAFSQAVAAYTQALEASNGQASRDPVRILDLQSMLAHALAGAQRPDSAALLLRQVAAERAATQGMTHPAYLADLSRLSAALLELEELEEAEATLRELLAVQRTAADSVELAATLNRLGLLLVRSNRSGEAVPLYTEARSILAPRYGWAHREVGVISANLAAALEDVGRFDEAEAIWRRQADVMVAELGSDSWRTGSATQALGRFYLRHGAPERGLPYLERAVRIYEAVLGPEHAWTAQARDFVDEARAQLPALRR